MKLIYKVGLPEASANDERNQLGTALAEAGVLDGDDAIVESLSNSAADLHLEGRYDYEFWSQIMAEELEELENSSFENLPLFRVDGDYSKAGYYELESTDVAPAHPNAPDVMTWSTDLRKVGTKQSRFRALKPNPNPNIDHEFGNDTDLRLGVPASARKIRWYDPETDATEPADSLETNAGEFDDVDIYDIGDGETAFEEADVDVDAPMLIFEIDYEDEARMDCKVYDTLDERSEQKYVETDSGQKVRIWESVFSTSHDPHGTLVLDNGLTRLWLDESDGTLEAQEWDSNAEEWADVGLEQPASIQLYDVDLESIAMVRDRAQLTFDVDGDLFALDAILSVGMDDVLFTIPEGETGPIPADLEGWLDPIASASVVDSNAAKTLVSRREVRK